MITFFGPLILPLRCLSRYLLMKFKTQSFLTSPYITSANCLGILLLEELILEYTEMLQARCGLGWGNLYTRKAIEREKAGKKLDPVQKSDQGRTLPKIAKAIGTIHS